VKLLLLVGKFWHIGNMISVRVKVTDQKQRRRRKKEIKTTAPPAPPAPFLFFEKKINKKWHVTRDQRCNIKVHAYTRSLLSQVLFSYFFIIHELISYMSPWFLILLGVAWT
jgi:hypothetical protein